MRLSWCIGLALALGGMGAAHAANFSVNPLKVILSPSKTSQILTIHNGADKPLRLEVESKQWGVNDKNIWVLSEDEDLVYTPELLDIPANSDAVLRVGADQPATDHEQTYRLLLTEIPDESAKPKTNGVSLTVRTQLSIPVFIEPPIPVKPEIQISAVQLKADHLDITFKNIGTKRLDAQGAMVDVLGSGDKVINHQQITSGYALAGFGMNMPVDLKAGECQGVESVRVVFTDPALTLTQAIPASNKSCSISK